MLSDIVVVGLNRKRNSKSLQDEHGPEVSHFYLSYNIKKNRSYAFKCEGQFRTRFYILVYRN